MKNLQQKYLWGQIAEMLTIKQYQAVRGYRSYNELALKVKKISKNKEIHRLADQIVEINQFLDACARINVDLIFNTYNLARYRTEIGIHLEEASMGSLWGALEIAERDLFPAIIVHS